MSDRQTIPTHDTPAAPRGARRVLFPLGAVLVGLLPLVLVELGLRAFDLAKPAARSDPFAGFGRTIPLFDLEGAVYRTARARAPLFPVQEFPAKKPPGSVRIFCFGGSTVYGHPYLADTAFPRWLEFELAGSDPARTWQVINCGGVSYASYRIVPLVEEVLQYEPDLIVLATGHNEFLEDRTYDDLKSRSAIQAWLQDRLHSLRLVGLVRGWLGPPARAATGAGANHAPPAGPGPMVQTRLDAASGYASYRRDPAWHARVAAQFEASVRTIVARGQAARVPIVLVRLGSNLRDCPPFKSEHRAGLAPEPEADWQTAFDLATAAEATDPARARQYYREAAAIDGQHALLSYRIARLLDRMGRPSEARPYYEQARDADICPLRINSTLERTLVAVAAATRTPLVDAAGLLAAASPDGIPGFDQYLDHVHPTISGHQRIAQALATELRTRGLLVSSAPWPEAQRTEAYRRHLAALGPAYFADGERRVGWLERWAQRHRLADEVAPRDAAGYVRLGFRRLELGRAADAEASLREGLHRSRDVAPLMLHRADELAASGRPDQAATLRRLLE